jgi:hypothetical protein
MTFEEFLRNSEPIDFRLRVVEKAEGFVGGYIHPLNVDGPTIDVFIVGDTLCSHPPEQLKELQSEPSSDEEINEDDGEGTSFLRHLT